jgi:hypothetical protein
MSEKHGLGYSAGDIESGMLENIDRMASCNPAEASTARLSRDLVNVIDRWLDDERLRRTDACDCIEAAMHGLNTVCGTILINLPDEARPAVGRAMRARMIEVFDAMLAAAGEAP